MMMDRSSHMGGLGGDEMESHVDESDLMESL
jgi:hypothetical protein